ncbi:hypothetical protein OP391_000947 [Escherichia coli]|nr:hypothetical protein [Escherichia coli]
MNADHNNAEDRGVMSAGAIPSTGEAFPAVLELSAFPLADFARRVRACDTPRRLDMLHTLMLRAVPVAQRVGYIALLNQRDEELSLQTSGGHGGDDP